MHHDEPLVRQIQDLVKPTESAINRFKAEMSRISKTVEEYNKLFGTDEDTIRFVRKNVEMNPDAIDKFIELEKAKGLNDAQIEYVKVLLTYIAQNGLFRREDLISPILPNFTTLFDNILINKLIEDLERIM